MSSRENRGRSGGASGRVAGSRKDPAPNPKGKARPSPDGKNLKVQEILSLVENLPMKDFPELAEVLSRYNLGSTRATLGSPAGGPEANALAGTLKDSSKGNQKDALPDLAEVPHEPSGNSAKDGGVDPKKPSEEASGATRRTMFRKARKAVRDARGNTRGTRSALLRLRYLAERFGSSLEDSLPGDLDIPAEILEGLDEESEGSDSEDEEVVIPPPLPAVPPLDSPLKPSGTAPDTPKEKTSGPSLKSPRGSSKKN